MHQLWTRPSCKAVANVQWTLGGKKANCRRGGHATSRTWSAIVPTWFCGKLRAGDGCRGHLLFYPSKIKLPLIVTLCCLFFESYANMISEKANGGCDRFLAHFSQPMRTDNITQAPVLLPGTLGYTLGGNGWATNLPCFHQAGRVHFLPANILGFFGGNNKKIPPT